MDPGQPGADGTIVVIGASIAVDAFALAGATVVPVDHPADVLRAWRALGPNTAVVVLTAAAAAVLGAAVHARTDDVLTVVMPP